jgi:cell division transport system permease protein
MRALRYAFDEAVASLRRGWRSGLLSTGTIAVALFVLGAFLLLTSNLERLGDEWSEAAQMSVYLADGITVDDTKQVEALLAPGPAVESFRYVSKSEALQAFRQTFGDLAAGIDSLERNPLPASYEVRLTARPGGGDEAERLADVLRQAPGVDDVRYDRQWLERLSSAVSVVRTIGFVLGAVLIFAAALTVANVVRLALFARRDEIEIMQLVGAPQAFIRGPFVMEGVLQGGLGAILALALLAAVFLAVHGRYLTPLAAAINVSGIRFLSPEVCVALLLGGMGVGCLGGLVAASGRT